MVNQTNRARRLQGLRERESCLYKITSHSRLAEILDWTGSPEALRAFARRAENYSRFTEKRPGKKDRLVEAPAPMTKRMQATFLAFLKQVRVPDYLESAIVGRSYLTNSQRHCDKRGCTVTVDIASFFQSISRSRVEEFFVTSFCHERDVAATVSHLLCCDGHLATGSPASPLVSFWALKNFFDRIDARAQARGVLFTLYIDDISLTGAGVSHGDIKWFSHLLQGAGLKLKQEKSRVYPADAPKLITGRAMRYGESRAPNSKHQKMVDARKRCAEFPKYASAYRSLAGSLRHIAMLDETLLSLRDEARELVQKADQIAPPYRKKLRDRPRTSRTDSHNDRIRRIDR